MAKTKTTEVNSAAVRAAIGEFQLIREIGRGSMGVVYEAVQKSLNRRVALKVLHTAGRSAEAIERFEREAAAVGKLAHSGIVPVYAVGEEDDVCYYAMQLLEGRTLRDTIYLERPTPGRAALLAKRISEALDYAHSQGIIHRDVKPANIIVTQGDQPVITDFGLARNLGFTKLTMSGIVLGTPTHMSPEQARGETQVDPRTDVYGIGVCLYEMLTFRLPFYADDLDQLLKKVITETPAAPRTTVPSVPKALEAVAMKCLAKRREDRYRSAGDVAADLKRFLEGEPVTAKFRAGPQVFVSSLRRGLRTHRRGLLIAVAVLVLALTIGLGYAAWRASIDAEVADEVERRLASTGPSGPVPAIAPPSSGAPGSSTAPTPGSGSGPGPSAEGSLRLTLAPVDAEGARVELRRGDGSSGDADGPVDLARPAALPAGSYVLTVAKEGFETATAPVLIEPGEAASVEVRLLRAGEAPPGFRYVPGGAFLAGADAGGRPGAVRPLPRDRLRLDAFLIAERETTCAEYVEFLNAIQKPDAKAYLPQVRHKIVVWLDQDGRWVLPPTWPPDRPITGVTLAAAEAYARWRAERDGFPYRLPTELEWEKAARGADGRAYPWGDSFREGAALVVIGSGRRPVPPGSPAPPSAAPGGGGATGPFPGGSFAEDRSVYGVLDVLGNAGEWTASWFDPDHPFHRVVRGGSFAPSPERPHLASRYPAEPDDPPYWVGIRLACSVPR